MIDLHCHSGFSDGSDAPGELVRMAGAAGLEALSITDHDTLDGFDEAMAGGVPGELRLLCGVELSTRSQMASRSVHLLGYFDRDPGGDFRAWLEELRAGRLDRNLRLRTRLAELGVDLGWDELEALGRRQVGRPHFAKLMVEKGYVASPREAFDSYLAEGGLAWVDREEPALEDAVRRVSEAGGLAVLAHPVRITRDVNKLQALVAELVPHGLEGLECLHPDHSPEEMAHYEAIAATHGLVVTGGSDYHGTYKPDICLGSGRDGALQVPSLWLGAMDERFALRRAACGV